MPSRSFSRRRWSVRWPGGGKRSSTNQRICGGSKILRQGHHLHQYKPRLKGRLAHHLGCISPGGREDKLTGPAEDTDGDWCTTHCPVQDPLNSRAGTKMQPRSEQFRLTPARSDRIAGPKDGAEIERRRISLGRIDVIARNEVGCVDQGMGMCVCRCCEPYVSAKL